MSDGNPSLNVSKINNNQPVFESLFSFFFDRNSGPLNDPFFFTGSGCTTTEELHHIVLITLHTLAFISSLHRCVQLFLHSSLF